MLALRLHKRNDDVVVLDGIFALFWPDWSVELSHCVSVVLALVAEHPDLNGLLGEVHLNLIFFALLADVFEREVYPALT